LRESGYVVSDPELELSVDSVQEMTASAERAAVAIAIRVAFIMGPRRLVREQSHKIVRGGSGRYHLSTNITVVQATCGYAVASGIHTAKFRY
jgi:hypothetical protein